MNPALRLGYEVATQVARASAVLVAGVASRSDTKAFRALSARRGIRHRYRAWGRQRRDPARPLLWMHAPSVGEGLQARPVLELARRHRSDVQLAYTFFSPSAESFSRKLDVDFSDYLPFDSAGDARAALDSLRPRALVFAKLDVWPTLAALAHDRGVRLGLVSATLAESSSRRSFLAAALLRDAYRLLDAVGAIDADDAERLVSLGVRPNVIQVTGDTRYDQVWDRAQRADTSSALLEPLRSDRLTIVAGSTWPADETVLLSAFAALRRRERERSERSERSEPGVAPARLVIAPHEPTTAHLAPIERWATETGLTLATVGSANHDTDVVLVDRVGILGDLYALADVAFVGGGFHDAGLHSVLEPAAFGAPVLFGPRHDGSRDARLLIERGGGRAVTDVPSLLAALAEWLEDSRRGGEAGAAARRLVRDGLGAAERSFRLVESLLAPA